MRRYRRIGAIECQRCQVSCPAAHHLTRDLCSGRSVPECWSHPLDRGAKSRGRTQSSNLDFKVRESKPAKVFQNADSTSNLDFFSTFLSFGQILFQVSCLQLGLIILPSQSSALSRGFISMPIVPCFCYDLLASLHGDTSPSPHMGLHGYSPNSFYIAMFIAEALSTSISRKQI